MAERNAVPCEEVQKMVLGAVFEDDGMNVSEVVPRFRCLHGHELNYRDLGFDRLVDFLVHVGDIEARPGSEGQCRVFVKTGVQRPRFRPMDLMVVKSCITRQDYAAHGSRRAKHSQLVSKVHSLLCGVCGGLLCEPCAIEVASILKRLSRRHLSAPCCPICRLKFSQEDFVPVGFSSSLASDLDLWMGLRRAPVRCCNERCQWKGEYGNFINHLAVCVESVPNESVGRAGGRRHSDRSDGDASSSSGDEDDALSRFTALEQQVVQIKHKLALDARQPSSIFTPKPLQIALAEADNFHYIPSRIAPIYVGPPLSAEALRDLTFVEEEETRVRRPVIMVAHRSYDHTGDQQNVLSVQKGMPVALIGTEERGWALARVLDPVTFEATTARGWLPRKYLKDPPADMLGSYMDTVSMPNY
eukprot:Polyplicarium_translucidae@DN2957_c0_g1_i6.p1